ncbi:hypothetical protein [Synechococcus elongatus]|uniref:hypothetical protein n=1 Tax=Synechococcus elongatus TaxID=32046 RepID=UPI000F7E8BF9|nr:hypothetical protein [Synechococcus elongatus]
MNLPPQRIEAFRPSRRRDDGFLRSAIENVEFERAYQQEREFSRLQRESRQRIADAAAAQQRSQQAGGLLGGIGRTILGALLPF